MRAFDCTHVADVDTFGPRSQMTSSNFVISSLTHAPHFDALLLSALCHVPPDALGFR